MPALGKIPVFLKKKEHAIEIISFLSLSVFSSLVFYFLMNWDMIVRILNARHMFNGGYYYEPMRAVLESFVIGLFSFISPVYAVYIFIFFVSAVFLVSVRYFSRAFKLDFAFLFMFLLSPFVLFYGIKNGSDLLVISFLILYIAMIMRDKPALSGVFLALAFVSKSYALLFSPLLLFFLWGKKRRDVVKLLISLAAAATALVPYFIYNLLEYGNLFYSVGLSYLYFHIFSSYVSLSPSIAHFESIPLEGFAEILFPLILLALLYLRNKKYFLSRIKTHKLEYSMITAAVFLSFMVYFSVSNLMQATGLSIFRFALPMSIFLYIMSFSFLTKKDMKFVYIIFAVSLLIAVFILYTSGSSAFHISYAKSAVAVFDSVYSGKCTVSSNEWVYLDYLGLDAVPPLSSYANYSGAILNFGSVNTSIPLVKKAGNIYLYGYNSCSYYPSLNESRAYYVMDEEKIPQNACYWLFGINPKINAFYSACNSLNAYLSGVLH